MTFLIKVLTSHLRKVLFTLFLILILVKLFIATRRNIEPGSLDGTFCIGYFLVLLLFLLLFFFFFLVLLVVLDFCLAYLALFWPCVFITIFQTFFDWSLYFSFISFKSCLPKGQCWPRSQFFWILAMVSAFIVFLTRFP